MWREVTVSGLTNAAPDLTARQMAVLMTIYLHDPPHTVRGLAKQLGLAKPAVTRALDALSRHGLLERERDDADRRNVFVQRTPDGEGFLFDFADRIAKALKVSPAK